MRWKATDYRGAAQGICGCWYGCWGLKEGTPHLLICLYVIL